MEISELITSIFQVCIIPLLGVLTTFLVKWIKAKSEALQIEIDDKTLANYLAMLTDTVTDCVIATNQTYVDSLKAQGKFDAEAQKVAFEQTRNAILAILGNDVKEYLTVALGDLNTYIDKKIEAIVNERKLAMGEVAATVAAANT